MDDLATWLRATVSVVQQAAERAAAEAGGAEWSYSSGMGGPIYLVENSSPVLAGPWDYLDEVIAKFVVLNDPRAVLLQCMADIEFLERYERASSENHSPDAYGLADDLLQARGSAYSYLPGYREEWRP